MKRYDQIIKYSEWLDASGLHELSDKALCKLAQTEEKCEECGKSYEDCECPKCTSCGELINECTSCDRCKECGKLNPFSLGYPYNRYANNADDLCYCDRCEECEELTDDCECPKCVVCDLIKEQCDCTRCSECQLLVPSELDYRQSKWASNNNDLCECDRCEECGALLSNCECQRCEECSEVLNDCECERCDECGELKEKCECTFDNFQGDIDFDNDLFQADQEQLFNHIGLAIEQLRLGILRQGSLISAQTLPMQQQLRDRIEGLTRTLQKQIDSGTPINQEGKIEKAIQHLNSQLQVLQSSPDIFVWNEATLKARDRVLSEIKKSGLKLDEDLSFLTKPVIPLSAIDLSRHVSNIERKLASISPYENVVAKHNFDTPYWAYYGKKGQEKNQELVIGLNINNTDLYRKYQNIWDNLNSAPHNKTGPGEIAFAFIVDTDNSGYQEKGWIISQIQSDIAPQALYLEKQLKEMVADVKEPMEFPPISDEQLRILTRLATNSRYLANSLNDFRTDGSSINFEGLSNSKLISMYMDSVIYGISKKNIDEYNKYIISILNNLYNSNLLSPESIKIIRSLIFTIIPRLIGYFAEIYPEVHKIDFSNDFNLEYVNKYDFIKNLYNKIKSQSQLPDVHNQFLGRLGVYSFILNKFDEYYKKYEDNISELKNVVDMIFKKTDDTSNLYMAPQVGGIVKAGNWNIEQKLKNFRISDYLAFMKDEEVKFLLNNWQSLLLKKISYVARMNDIPHIFMDTPERIAERIDFGNKSKPDSTYGKIQSEWGFQEHDGRMRRVSSKFKMVQF